MSSSQHHVKFQIDSDDETTDNKPTPNPLSKFIIPIPDERDFSDPSGGKARSRTFVFTYFPLKPEGIRRDTGPVGYHTIHELATVSIPTSEHIKAVNQLGDYILNPDGSKVKFTKYLMTCLLFAPEIAPTTGSPHLQGFCKFTDPITFPALRKRLSVALDPNRIWLREANGTIAENISYIVGPYENGTKSKPRNPLAFHFVDSTEDVHEGQSASRNIRDDIMEDVLSGKYSMSNIKELMLKYRGAWLTYGKQATACLRLLAAPVIPTDKCILPRLYPWQARLQQILLSEPVKRRIIFVTGPPGIGKSDFLKHVQASLPDKVLDCPVAAMTDWNGFVQIYPWTQPSVIMFNYPITSEVSQSECGFLETLSDFVYCRAGTKYEGRPISVEANLVVFTNHQPPFLSLPKRILHFSIGGKERTDGVYDYVMKDDPTYSPF
jgi:hypothetical protein